MTKIGLGIARKTGSPPNWIQNSHVEMLRLGRRAETLGFDSVWVPDHFHFERPPGTLTPFPEAWTLMTALAVTTERVQVASMVLAAAFRHPALMAHMAGALQDLCGGRLLLGLGAGNQTIEHGQFGFEFERRVGALDEYLQIMSALLDGRAITLKGRHYQVNDATLLYQYPKVPLLIAAGGDRMMGLTARYADSVNLAGAGTDEAGFRAKLGQLLAACRAQGRNPAEDRSNVLVDGRRPAGRSHGAPSHRFGRREAARDDGRGCPTTLRHRNPRPGRRGVTTAARVGGRAPRHRPRRRAVHPVVGGYA